MQCVTAMVGLAESVCVYVLLVCICVWLREGGERDAMFSSLLLFVGVHAVRDGRGRPLVGGTRSHVLQRQGRAQVTWGEYCILPGFAPCGR